MKIFNIFRGGGKTTHLIHISAYSKAVIITHSFASKRHIIETANKLHLDIPEPLTISEFKNYKSKGVDPRKNNHGILIDDFETIIDEVLSDYFDQPVLAITSSIPMTKKEDNND